MRKTIALAIGATLLGSMVAIGPAEARPGYRHYGGGYHAYPRAYGYGYRYHRRGNAGAAAVAGIAGALIGGAIASQQPRYYAPGYGYPAYGPPAYYEGY